MLMPIILPTFRKKLIHGLTGGLFLALLVSLWMVADALQNSARFERMYSTLLLLNAIALIAIATLIIFNLRELVYQVNTRRAGARLTVRLLSLLVILSILPVLLVYYFSLEFLHQRLDTWFDTKLESALTDALELSRAVLDARLREVLKQTQAVADELELVNQEVINLRLSELLSRTGAIELTLLAANGSLLTSSTIDPGHLIPNRPNEGILLQLKQTDNYLKLEPITNHGFQIRVIVKLGSGNQIRLLQALFPITERISELTNNVSAAFVNYKERAYLQKHLQLNFTLVLSLVLLLSIAGVVWVAFFAAWRFVAPLSHLAEGTRAVASGNYEKQLPVAPLDELGFLVQSFNDMTRKIAQAQDEVKQSQQLMNNQRAYLEAVLEQLSSGVIALDYEHRLRTANPAANRIFELPLGELLGHTLAQLQPDYSTLTTLCQAIQPHLFSNVKAWREEITLLSATGRKTLVCRGTQLQLSAIEYLPGGYVIVFDDVTTLIQAQREAAWSEVARRLAHEIKNPLTPIQLSAEHLRHKYLSKLPNTEVDTLDRLTKTIIQQVESLKDMVNAFSDYAKTPPMQWQVINLNQLIREVTELYRHSTVPIQLELDEQLPLIEADSGRLRQVLHNLLKNALEVPLTTTKMNDITLTARYLKPLTEPLLPYIELAIQDQGPGVPLELLDKIFEPYVTTKIRGSGLGLAIVKKIIEEHSGVVWIENRAAGACVIIRMPAPATVEGVAPT